jgi:hypothetical protein
VAIGTSTVEVYVFYFDVIGFVDEYLAHGSKALDRLRTFQRSARAEFVFGHKHSYVVTLYDNVWARFNAIEPGMPSLLLDFAGRVMRAAHSHGFHRFFGSVTRGVHDFDPNDRMLVGGESFEDLKEQHLDVTSEPHIRAAFADKWSRLDQFPKDCVWVCNDVVDLTLLPAHCAYPDSAVEAFGEEFDLAQVPLQNGQAWPFGSSKFRAIRARNGAT